MFRIIRANILYGVIVLIPIAAFILIAYYIFDIWKKILRPFANELGLSTPQSQVLAVVLSLLLLLAVCFVIGAIIRTRLGTWTFDKIEANFLNHLPAYGIISNLLRGFADQEAAYQPALVTLVENGAEVLGFIMEDNGAPLLTIFVPSAPMMTIGQIHMVKRQNVRLIEGSTIEAANCLSQWGVGMHDYLRGTPQTHQS